MVIFNCMHVSCPVLLHFLVQLCNKNVIVIILAIYMCIQDGFNAVHLAACGGHVSLVRELVDVHHANVHQKTKVLYFSLVSA